MQSRSTTAASVLLHSVLAVIGGLVQIVLYTIVKIPLYGQYGALAEVPLLAGQTVCGIVFGSVLYLIFEKSSVLGRLQRLCRG